MHNRFTYISMALLSAAFTLQGCGNTQTSANTPTAPAVKTESSAPSEEAKTVSLAETTEKPAAAAGPKVFKTVKVYTDANSPDNTFTPSGWMGDFGDIKFNDKYMENPHSGTTSLQVVYTNKATQGARWAGIYWQNPPNNWGTRPGGYDLTGAKKVTFWARGEKGGERIEEFKIGGITGEYADSDVAGIGPVVLTKEWQQYTIDLDGKDLSSISGGFCWATNLDVNPDGATFYLDDIKYE